MNTTLDAAVLHVERVLPHPVSKLWRCLTEPDLLRNWFPSQVEMDLRVGGAIRFFGDPNLPESTAGTITELDPPRLLAFDWGGDQLRWQVRPHELGSLLILDQTLADRPGAASFAAGWNVCLDALSAELTGPETTGASGAVGDGPGWPERHEKFVAAFGLDSGSVSSAEDGWRVGLERQLTVPVDRARDLLQHNALYGAELREDNGGARMVAARSGLDRRDQAETLLGEWETVAREVAERAVLVANR